MAAVNELNIKSNNFDKYSSISYVDISSVSKGRLLSRRQLDPIKKEKLPRRAKRLVRHGDTIWSTIRPNRKSYLFIHSPESNMVVSTGFAVITPKKIPASYLYGCLTTDEFIHYLSSNADGTVYPAVKPTKILDAKIVIPPLPILYVFDRMATCILDLVWSKTRESDTLTAIRDSLLPKFFSRRIEEKKKSKRKNR